MKKINILLFAAFSVSSLLSCSDDLGIETEVNKGPEVVATGKLLVTGTINKDPETRVSFADGGTSITPSWEVGDQVFGFYGDNTLTYEVASINGEGVANFSLVNGTEPADGITVHMIYAPAKSASDLSEGQLAIDLSTQDGTLASMKNHAIMCATATVDGSSLSLQFENQVAIVGVKQFTGLKASTTYTSATFSAYGPTAKVSVVDGELKLVTDRTYGTITATGSFASDESGNTTETIYFAVPPHETAVPHTFDLNASDDRRTGSISAKAITAGKYLYMNTKSMEVNSLVQQWLFNGNTNNSVSSVNAVLGSSAPTLTTDRFGNANSAYYFNGSSTMTVSEEGFNFGRNSFTANVWIHTSSTTMTGVLRSDDAWQSNGCLLRLNYGKPEIWEGRETSYQYVSDVNVNNGAWHMLTYVRDAEQREGCLYVDGSYIGGYNISGTINNVTRMLSIGFVDRFDFMVGKIDDISLYNKALTAKQVANLYTPAPSLAPPTPPTPPAGKTGTASVLESAGRPNNECGWVQLWENGPRFATMFVGSTEADYSNCTSYSQGYCGGMYGYNSNAATTVWGPDWAVATLEDYRQMYAGFNTSSEQDMQLSPTSPNEGTNCIWEWMDGSTKQYTSGCTIKGWKVSGKGAYAANSIFFPASGCNGTSRVGEIGVYYTATGGNRLYFDYSGSSIDMRVYTGDSYHMLAKLAEATTGTAAVLSSAGCPNNECGWVQLWAGGPKWAEYNLGAANNKAEDFGDYYSFDGAQTSAATLWGDNWRTPTKEDLQGILNNCDLAPETVNGVYGLMVTGKGSYSTNQIFLPAGGYIDSGATQASRSNELVRLWSCNGYAAGGLYGWCLCFDGGSCNPYISAGGQYFGHSVRAVLNE